MFGSEIIDVAIGMILVYLLLSLMCSAANEVFEALLKNRASDLEKGLRELLTRTAPDPSQTTEANHDDILKALYDHPLINGMFRGAYTAADLKVWWPRRAWRWLSSARKLPSYIPARAFALAMMDLSKPGATDGDEKGTSAAGGAAANSPLATVNLRQAIGDNALMKANPKVQGALLTLVDAAGNDANKARENIEDWYNGAMDRVSGFYKRRTQMIIFVIGLIVVVGVNADSVTTLKQLSTDKALRESVVAAAQEYAKADAFPSPTPSTPPESTAAAVKPRSPSSSQPASASPSPQASAAGATQVGSPTDTKAAAKASPTPARACAKDPNSAACKYEKSQEELRSLGLPLGWDSQDDLARKWPGWHWKHPGGWWHQIYWHGFGWLLTILAISLGAPFWFDMLNKFITVRSTLKPKEKSPDGKTTEEKP